MKEQKVAREEFLCKTIIPFPFSNMEQDILAGPLTKIGA
jgi:hypothetical protein